jgi:hypothetical protein
MDTTLPSSESKPAEAGADDFLLGFLIDLEDGEGHLPPKRRALSQLYSVTTQNTILVIT